MHCTLRRCQGKFGCVCPKKPAPGFYGSPVNRTAATESFEGINKPAPTKRQPPVNVKRIVSSSPKKTASKAHPKSSPAPSAPTGMNGSKESDQKSDNKADEKQDILEDKDTGSNGNGTATICYSHYKKPFPITNGATTAAVIDAEYYLTFAFPNCKMRLSQYSPSDFSYEDDGLTQRPMLHENPEGTYHGLVVDNTYWVHVEEDSAEREAYERRQDAFAAEQAKRRAEDEANEAKGLSGVKQEKGESCSCIEGNPCMDSYGCKDWNNRYAVAKKNGWKGF
jgi:hypothetical protein